jgi:hypothetical protein
VTTRNAAATASIAVILLTSIILSDSLVNGAGADESVGLVNLLGLPVEVVYRVYGERTTGEDAILGEVQTAAVVAAYVAWTTLFAAFVRYRYQRLDVTR